MTGKQDVMLLFSAQIRALEWLGQEPEDSLTFCPVLIESKRMIVIVVDAFEDGPFTKIILSKN